MQLNGLYLSRNLRSLLADADTPPVQTNFLISLDGRISQPDPATGRTISNNGFRCIATGNRTVR